MVVELVGGAIVGVVAEPVGGAVVVGAMVGVMVPMEAFGGNVVAGG
jgi:hypothetical protein